MRPPPMTHDRQAQIQRMVQYDRERARQAKFDPSQQDVGELRTISEYYKHNNGYTEQKMVEKFRNLGLKSKYFCKESESREGKIDKLLVQEGTEYRTPTRDDTVTIFFSTNIVEVTETIKAKNAKIKTKEAKEEENSKDIARNEEQKVDNDEPEIEELDCADEENEVEEKELWYEKWEDLTFNLFNEDVFHGLDATVQSMRIKELAEMFTSGKYNDNLDMFLERFSMLEDKAAKLKDLKAALEREKQSEETMKKDGANGNRATTTVKVKAKIILKDFTKIIDIKNDKGVLKQEIVAPTNFEGLGWAQSDDEAFVKISLLKGLSDRAALAKKSKGDDDSEVDLGDFIFCLDDPPQHVKKVLPPGLIAALQEVKKSEVAHVKLHSLRGVNRLIYEKYAPPDFRKRNDLDETGELIYKVEITKILKVFDVEDGAIKYKILDKGDDGDINSPKTMQLCALKARLYVNQYSKKKTIGVDGEEYVEKELVGKKFLVGLGCKGPEEEKELKATTDLDEYADIIATTGGMHYFMELVLMKMGRNQKVIATTTDNSFVFGSTDIDIVIKNMYMENNSNITSGEMKEYLETIKDKTDEEKLVLIRQKLLSFVKNDDGTETEFEAEMFLPLFESKDTYWDVKPNERRQLIMDYKAMGNKFFKTGSFKQALDCYRSGSDVYSKYNFAAIDDKAQQTLVKPLKIGCMLNMATAYFKMDDHLKMSETLDDALKLDEKYPKTFLKRANLNISLGNLDKAKEDLKTVKGLDATFPGLRREVQRLKAATEAGKAKTKNKFGGFLQKDKDILATPESREEKPKKEKEKTLNFEGVDPKDWAKKAQEFYGITDMDLD